MAPFAKPPVVVGVGPRHYTNCRNWDYKEHPDRQSLTERCERLEVVMQRRPGFFRQLGHDTRVGHAYMFQSMMPEQCGRVIGRFRGDQNCAELANFPVRVDADPRVGSAPREVARAMQGFEERCESLLQVHARWLEMKGAGQPARNALIKFVDVLANVAELFLRIHPYMDGNGHSARMLTYLMMTRVGYLPIDWSIDGKKDYSEALSLFRDNRRGKLQAFFLKAIAG